MEVITMNYIFLIAVVAVIIAVFAIASFTNFELDDLHYDRLKWVVQRGHYFVVFLGVIVEAFKVPYGAETITVAAGVFALMAGVLDVSSKNYYATRSCEEMTEEEAYEFLNNNPEMYDAIEAIEEGEEDE